MIKFIISDLDKTLLRSDVSLSDYTVSVLRECRARGIKTAFATARSIQAAQRFFEQFTPDISIVYGGGITIAGDYVVSRFAIPAETSAHLISDCLRTPGVTSVLAINETVAYRNKIDPPGNDYSHYECVDFSLHKDISYLKISLCTTNPTAAAHIAVNYPELDFLRYSGEDLYRFSNRNAVKWNAILSAADYLGIAAADCAAFGDDVNDTEMIANCGVGVAVENAVAEVRAAAGYICGANDADGVANWIKQNIL